MACQCVGITIQVPGIVHRPNPSAIVWWNPRIEWEHKWERSIGYARIVSPRMEDYDRRHSIEHTFLFWIRC